MPIIMLMPPMCARPPCPLRAATRPAAPRQSSPQEPATQFSTAPAARRRRQQRPVPADTPTSHIERGPLSVLDFSSSQCRPQSVLLLSGTRCPPDFAPLPQGMRNKPSSALGRAPRPGRPQRAASRRHQSAGHLSRGQQIDVRAGTAAEDDTGGTAALPKKGHCARLHRPRTPHYPYSCTRSPQRARRTRFTRWALSSRRSSTTGRTAAAEPTALLCPRPAPTHAHAR